MNSFYIYNRKNKFKNRLSNINSMDTQNLKNEYTLWYHNPNDTNSPTTLTSSQHHEVKDTSPRSACLRAHRPHGRSYSPSESSESSSLSQRSTSALHPATGGIGLFALHAQDLSPRQRRTIRKCRPRSGPPAATCTPLCIWLCICCVFAHGSDTRVFLCIST